MTARRTTTPPLWSWRPRALGHDTATGVPLPPGGAADRHDRHDRRRAAWSTRELAELAGTTVRAIRHYHDLGLLDEPERRANGYKQYDLAHLVRLRRIAHLRDLGFSLAAIGALGEHDPSPQALDALDAELAGAAERLQRARSELGALLRRAG